ncbi:MAG: shikimate dehydrogenase [Gammaproteobacteria bacterium]|nr:MAG: shikimate dehydrogenase [Gammaproteobacteria bacterium]
MVADRYAVFGHPVAHSLSPRIHALFAAQTGESLTYEAIEAPRDDFAGTARAFFAAGGRGANVTLPFKGEAIGLADACDAAVARAGAANTLRREADGRLTAFNTDGIGLRRDLECNLRCPLQACTVVMLGAGGAAAGVIEPLLNAGVARLVIGNRSPDRAAALASRFADFGPVLAMPVAELPPADLLINATAASLDGALPELAPGVVHAHTFAYDMVYAARPTSFLTRCQELGAARVADGLGMLVEQAAEAFLIWRGVRPETAPVLAQLRPQADSAEPS